MLNVKNNFPKEKGVYNFQSNKDFKKCNLKKMCNKKLFASL